MMPASVAQAPASSTQDAAAKTKGPLAGLQVLDLTSVLMGPYATQVLGDMGAQVIKVEAPEGDIVRQIGPARHAGMGPIFLNTNRSKRSIVLDLKTASGLQALLRLAAKSDVFIYNIRPQALARLGLSYEALQAVNPGIVYVGVFGYGEDGPYAGRPAYDDLIQGASTLSSLFARDGGAPRYVPAAIVDRITGLTAVNAILAAIYERQHSGQGQRIDIPMFETMVGFILSDHLAGCSFQPPLGESGYERLLAPSRKPYRTRDGYVSALIYTDKHWRAFYRLLGREQELDSNPQLATFAERAKNIEQVYRDLGEMLLTRTTAQWLQAFEAADIPAVPVHDLGSIFTDPHLEAISYFGLERHPTEGNLRTMRHPGTWSRTQPGASRPAPQQGEHGVEVLREAGFSGDEIDQLIGQGGLIVPTSSVSLAEP